MGVKRGSGEEAGGSQDRVKQEGDQPDRAKGVHMNITEPGKELERCVLIDKDEGGTPECQY